MGRRGGTEGGSFATEAGIELSFCFVMPRETRNGQDEIPPVSR